MRPDQPVGEAVAVADRVAEREARRLVDLLERLAQLEEARVIVGDLVEAGLLERRLAVDERAGGAAERDADPGVGTWPSCRTSRRGSSSRRSACRGTRRGRTARSACRHRCAGPPPSRARCRGRRRCWRRPPSAGGCPPSPRNRRASRRRWPAGTWRCWRGRSPRRARRSGPGAGCASWRRFSIGLSAARRRRRVDTCAPALAGRARAAAAPPAVMTQRVAPGDDDGRHCCFLPVAFLVDAAGPSAWSNRWMRARSGLMGSTSPGCAETRSRKARDQRLARRRAAAPASPIPSAPPPARWP